MLFDELIAIAAAGPERRALADDAASLTFAELCERAEAIARRLHEHGLRKGDRLAILAGNGIVSTSCFWAAQRLGAIVVWLNEQLPAAGLAVVLADARPRLVLAGEREADRARAALARASGTAADTGSGDASVSAAARAAWVVDVVSLAAMAPVAANAGRPSSQGDAVATRLPEVTGGPDRIAAIVYTSGSTGRPKGVSLTHGNLSMVGHMAAEDYGTVAGDSYLMVVPLHYIHGLMILMCMHLRGAAIHFAGNFVFPRAITQQLIDTGVTGFSGVPYHLQAMVERGGLLEASLPSLRWIGITGGRAPVALLEKIARAHPAIEIHISYGLTECSPRITALDPARVLTKPASVGAPPPELTVSFLDENGQAVPDGEIGELVVAGPTVMAGYWNAPEATREVIDEQRRLHTGDLAWRDAEGDIFIRGRVKAMIKTAGERIFPEELEAIIERVTGVRDVAVIGVPDALYGQRVEACVVLDDTSEAALAALRASVLEHVPLARSPKHYRVYAALPKTANGKTDKPALLAELSAADA
ncbi:MAG: hypothetical protein CSB44_04070 [Gammaproteobacteria bacterium]|nr:MAG: hypothetical protein CSB44_04070 [Gammaproteobacteria bacterium]